MNKSELLAFLHEIGARPQKRLSQNFLIDNNILAKIIALADVHRDERILEVGPGPGALTQKLLAAGARVTAVEKDACFAKHLLRLQTEDLRLEVFSDDFLKWDIPVLLPPWKVVANLPYNITTPILEKLCQDRRVVSSLTIMVQKEVADRIRAKPGTKAFGSLTLFLQFYCDCTGAFPVSASSFYPEPKVSSTVLRLDLKKPPDVDPEAFFFMIHKAYQQRRKMVAVSLRSYFPGIKESLEALSLSAKVRPEELSLEQWIALYRIRSG